MTAPKKPKAPPGLAARGRKVWAETTTTYDLRVDELATLQELCRTFDVIDAIEAALRGAPLLIEGSQGQPRPNPLLQELRGHRQVVVQLVRSLGLADVPEEADDGKPLLTPKQARAVHAARARWGPRGA